MGSVSRTVKRAAAVVGIAGVMALGAASVATAAETAPVTTQASGTYHCGMDYEQCIRDRNLYRHLGHQVSEIYYREGQTCPGGGGCGDGYYFHWWI